MTNATARTRFLAVLGLLAFVAATFPLFWNFPGNDSHGEGPGHALGHLTWSIGLLVLGRWLWAQRASFAGGRGPVIAVAGVLVAAGAQLLESVGATVVWATGKHAEGNFAVHDVAAAGGNTLAVLVLATGFLTWGATAVARRLRQGRSISSTR